MGDSTMKISIGKAIKAISPNSEYMIENGDINNIIWLSPDIPQPSAEEIQTKIAELEAAEPLRLLRIERDRLLQQTDWEIQRNTERNIDSTELITYRNALRDLPQDISANNVPSPTLSETGELLFAHWPNRYEINIENTQTANNSANTV